MERATAPARSGIAQKLSGDAYIPSSTRADGSKRKEIRVRPGYTPPEDVETYKNQRADDFKNRGKASVPGAEGLQVGITIPETKSKNAKRREATKKKAKIQSDGVEAADDLHKENLDEDKHEETLRNTKELQTGTAQSDADEAERQKKIRNSLKKLKAVRELKEKKTAGEKLSVDQIAKIGKESELLRDLRKLKYDGPETENDADHVKGSSNQVDAVAIGD